MQSIENPTLLIICFNCLSRVSAGLKNPGALNNLHILGQN